MSERSESDRRDFVLHNTRLLRPPLVPELILHLAEESLPIWQKTEEELGAINLPPPFWAFAWAGGQALARYLLDNRGLVAGKKVLDIGCGSGIGAIAAAMAGASAVTAIDIDPLAATAVALNAAANGVTVGVCCEDILADAPPSAGTILVGDLFYEQALSERVLAWVEAARRGGALVLVGDPRRSYFPAARFVQMAAYDVPVTRELEDAEIKRSAVWQLAD